MSKKVILVTGASSGFGKIAVEKLLAKGYIVYAAARRLERMNDLKKKGAHVIGMDVTSDEQVSSAIEQIISDRGRIDILVNNAGYGGYGMLECVSMEEAHNQFDVNVFGLMRVTKEVLPHMRKQKSGTIINLASLVGKVAPPMIGWYGASKHAVEALSDSLRAEVKGFGIKVVVIEPGAVQTGFWDVAKKQIETVKHDKVYKANVDGFVKTLSNNYANAPGPNKVADVIVKSIEKNNPRTNYLVGADANLGVMMKNIMPTKVMDNLWRVMFKMR